MLENINVNNVKDIVYLFTEYNMKRKDNTIVLKLDRKMS